LGAYFGIPETNETGVGLQRFYEKLAGEGKQFEIIFVSRDREADDLVEYFQEKMGKWTYLKFGDPKIQSGPFRFLLTLPRFSGSSCSDSK
jgi:hypothetical protein